LDGAGFFWSTLDRIGLSRAGFRTFNGCADYRSEVEGLAQVALKLLIAGSWPGLPAVSRFRVQEYRRGQE